MSDHSEGTQTWIDRIATPFDRAWQAGEHPRIEDYLAGVAEPRRSQLLEELLRVELGNRRAAGETPGPEEYVIRFPQDEAKIRAVVNGGADRRSEVVVRHLGEPCSLRITASSFTSCLLKAAREWV